MDKLDRLILAHTIKTRDLAKARAQAHQAEASFNSVLGLRQFTTPDGETTRHHRADPTAWKAITTTQKEGK